MIQIYSKKYLSHNLIVQLPIIHKETITTIKMVPGQMVINVLSTNIVLKLILFKAPMLREDASVNNLLCKSITRQIK